MPRILALALTGLLLAGCGGDGGTAAPPSATPSASPSASPTESPTPTSTLPAGIDQVITLTVRGGKVTGDTGRVRVKLGDRVRLVVTSDVADEAHLHGFDKTLDLKPGRTAHLDVDARIPGTFAFELHDLHLVLTRLQVR